MYDQRQAVLLPADPFARPWADILRARLLYWGFGVVSASVQAEDKTTIGSSRLGRGRRREGGSEGGALNRGAASACAHTTRYVGGDGHFEHHRAFHHDNAQFAFLSEVWIWKPSHEIPIAAVAVSAMRPDALGR
jgi:hypothetical protein